MKNAPFALCGIYLVVKVSKLTMSVKWLSEANVTNSFQAFCSVPDNARPLSFKNQNVRNENFTTKMEVRNHAICKKKCCISTIDIRLTFFFNFDILPTK